MLTVLVTVGAAFALSIAQRPVYEAIAAVIIQPSVTQQILDPSTQNAPNAARNITTQVAVLQSRAVRDAAKRELGHTPDVSILSSDTSDVVNISARSTNGRRAAADANGYAAAYVAYRRQQTVDDVLQVGAQLKTNIAEIDARLPALRAGSPELTTAEQRRSFLQQQLDQLEVSTNLSQTGGTRILAKADLPSSPVTPQPIRNAAIALVLGLLLGVGLALLRDYFDDAITSREDLERAAEGLPVLGEIPRFGRWRRKDGPKKGRPSVVTFNAPTSRTAEAFRSLRTAVQFLGVDRKLCTIQVTSANADEGKTEVVVNLAVVCARAGLRVAIVCCDLRRPRVHEYFGFPNDVGLTSLILGTATLHEALRRVPDEPNLRLLSAGPPPPNPSELLGTSNARQVIASLEEIADLVLIDCPPVLPVSDALIVSGTVDATLLVASTKLSSRRTVRRTLEMLRSVDAPLLGAVLNMVDHNESVAAYGPYGYVEPSERGSGGGRAARRAQKQVARSGG